MRIVLTHPFCWPYVRRGTERNVDVLARYLVARGHEVTTVSTHPAEARVERDATGLRVLHRPIAGPLLSRLRVNATHTFFFSSWRTLGSLDADVVHSFYVSDGLAACCANRGHRYRTVLQLNGAAIPGVSCRRWFPPEANMFRTALRRADVRIVCSRFVRDLLREHYGVDAEVVWTPVAVESYETGTGPLGDQTVILAVGDFNVRRKGAAVLVKAFELLKRDLPAARLRLSGRISAERQQRLLDSVGAGVRADIEVLGLGAVDDLPRLYAEASVTVLPSMWEPSGTVLLESLAAGTPVVATDHGGMPEFVTADVGVLFDPQTDGEETHNAKGLTQALLEGIELARRPETRRRCRAHALQFSSAVLGPQIEALYGAH